MGTYDYASYLEKLRNGKISINPFLAFLGVTLEEIKKGYVSFKLPIKPEYLQGAGIMQGGLIVAMADETIAHAIMTLVKPNEGLTTINLKCDFLSPAKRGHLISEARVFKKGKTLAIGDCVVNDDEGNAVARVTATFLLLDGSEKRK
jgi:uncharacterized protein (TIGR00369 family)